MARPRQRGRPGGVFARVPRPEWLSWLEEQEQKPAVFVPPNNPVVEEFDPLQERARVVEEDLGEWERWGQQGKGRNREILKRWFFTRDLENSIAAPIGENAAQALAVSVDLKAILDRQPLRIGLGRLPAWLRNKHEVIALDQYEDALCIFRCITVHQGARRDRNVRITRQLAQSFLAAYPKILPPIAVNKLYWVEQHFKQGIAAYTVTQAGDFVLSHTPARYDKVGRPTMTIGNYGGHAFLITDIKKVTNNYTCGDCGARFTQAYHLTRHAKTYSRGQTKFDCPGNRVLAPDSSFEKAFYPNSSFGIKAVCWLKYEAKQRGIHIHHQRCGHGG